MTVAELFFFYATHREIATGVLLNSFSKPV